VVLLAGSRRGLVDLLVARRRVLGAHVDGGAHVLELEVIGLGPYWMRLVWFWALPVLATS
jgi:hypothetical protein